MGAEVVGALSAIAHTPLAKENPYAFAVSRIREMIGRPGHANIAVGIASLFLDRFNPAGPLDDAAFAARSAALSATIKTTAESTDAVALLSTMLAGT